MRFLPSIAAGVLLCLAGITSAPPIVAAPGAQTTSAWTGYYFANRHLQGEPVLTRQDRSIDFAWEFGAPGSGVPVDDFSVRWVRWVFFDAPGAWVFVVTSDDGARLFVDNRLVLDAWFDQTATTRIVTVNLTQTFHLVRMEYYDRGGNAQARLQIFSGNFPDWRGEYYANPRLAGTPAFTRNDSAIEFDFGAAGPGGGVPGENFSARWTRVHAFEAGRYRFTTTTDDGVRLWVDHQLVIDHWNAQTPTSWSGEIALAAGDHLLKIEYYNGSGPGSARLTWEPLAEGSEIWRGEYFDNSGLTGTPAFSRNETEINFDWGNAPPGKGISSGNWSARFTAPRTLDAPGYYTLAATADDGVRVWADGKMLIDEWHDQAPTTHAALVYLAAGKHEFRVEYYNHLGSARLIVRLVPGAQFESAAPLPAGDLIVSPSHPNFVKGSAGDGWQSASNGYDASALWVMNNTFALAQFNWARWYAPLSRQGDYEVSVYLPAGIGTTRHARYWVAHAGTYDFRRVNQSLYANQWVSLGVFRFDARGDEYVSLSDVTHEPTHSTKIVADAVRFSPREKSPTQ